MPLPSVKTVPRDVWAVLMVATPTAAAWPPGDAAPGDGAALVADGAALEWVLLVPAHAAAVSAAIASGTARTQWRTAAAIGFHERCACIGGLPITVPVPSGS
jgi:hypothetical protein